MAKTNFKKLKSLSFVTILATTLGEASSGVHMNFGEWICCVLYRDVVWTFSSIWSHVNGNEKLIGKIQNLRFHNSFKKCGRCLPYENTWVLRSEYVVYLHMCLLKVFLPFDPIVTYACILSSYLIRRLCTLYVNLKYRNRRKQCAILNLYGFVLYIS